MGVDAEGAEKFLVYLTRFLRIFFIFARFPGIKRSEEKTSELQSHLKLVCRLLVEKKKKKKIQSSARIGEEKDAAEPGCEGWKGKAPV